MLIDGLNLLEGSKVTNLVVSSGPSFPQSPAHPPDIGELFYLTGTNAGLYVFQTNTNTLNDEWMHVSTGAAAGASSQAHYIVAISDPDLVNAQVLADLPTGFVKNATTTGTLSVASSIDLSTSDVSGILGATHFPQLAGDLTNTAGSNIISLSDTAVTPGAGYNVFTVDSKGRITSAATIAYLTANQTITVSGDVAGSGTTSITLTLSDSGVSAGTYTKVTVDSKGRVTSASNPTTLSGYGITNAVSANAAITAGTATKVTYDSKGLITSGTTLSATDIPNLDWSKITSGTPTTLVGYGITDAISNSHLTDYTLHLTSAQNTWLDAITVASSEVNFLTGATSNIQTQLSNKLSLSGGTVNGNIVIPTGYYITLTDAPSASTSAVNKAYVDSVIAGLTWKNSVLAATTVNITLSGLQAIDGYTTLANDRILVKNQTTASQNGIYIATTGTWQRATDFDAVSPFDEINGAAVYVEQGSTQNDTGWTVTSNVSTIGTDVITWTQFNGASGITAGTGLSKSGNILNVNLGAGIIELPTDEVGIDLYTNGGLFTTVDGTNASTANTSQLAIKLTGTTLNLSASGLKVTAGGITATEINSSALGTGLTGGSGISISLASVVVAGTGTKVTYDAYGRVTSSTTLAATDIPNLNWSKITSGTPTTLAGYGITDAVSSSHTTDFTLHLTSAQNTWLDTITVTAAEVNYLSGVSSAIQTQFNEKQTLNANLTSVAALSTATTGLVKFTAGVASFDTNAYITGVTLTGEVTGSGSGTISTTLATVGPTKGGTGLTTYTTGDLLYASAANTLAKLAGNTTATKKFLTQTGTGTVSAAPAWNALTAGDITGALTFTPINVAGDTMTGALTLSGDPTQALHATTKQYVDNSITGLDFKNSCRVASTANITLSGLQTIDGVSVIANDRVLVKNQTTASQNGIYVADAGAWTRSTDADGSPTNEVSSGLYTFVEEGTSNADSGWVLTTNNPITVGTTSLAFTQFTGLGQVVAGAGLTKTGSQLDVGTASASRIVVNADNIDLATTGVTAGTWNNVTVDTYGRATGGSNIAYLTSYTETDTLASVTGRGATTATAISLTNATASTNATTGALVVLGGVGVTGAINASQWLTMANAGIPAGFWAGSGLAHSYGYLGSNGAFAFDLVGNGYRNNSAGWTSLNANAQTGRTIISLNPIGIIEFGADILSSGTRPTIRATLNELGQFSLSANITSTSTSTGTLVVTGGTGVSGALYTGGTITSAGDLAINGGDLTSTATTFNLLTATVTTLNVASSGTTTTINGTVKLPNLGTSGFVKLSTGGQLVQDTSTYLTSYTETDTLATVTGRGATTATALTLTNATASTSTSTGALVVTGGAGIGGAIYAASGQIGTVRLSQWTAVNTDIDALIGGSIAGALITGQAAAHITVAIDSNDINDGFQIISKEAANPTYTLKCFEVKANGNMTWAGTAQGSDNTASTTTTTGAIVTAGGVGVAGQVTAATFSGNGAALTSLNASNLSTGTVAAARMPAFTGDATSTAGTTALTLASVGTPVTSSFVKITTDSKGRVSGTTAVALTDLTDLGAAPINNPTFTGTVTLAANPTLALHAATKQYVDSIAAGLDPKESVRAATTANVTLSGGAPNTLDGVTLAASDRILVKNQTTASQNGIYTVTTLGTGANGTWSRASDFDGTPSNEVSAGAFTFVEEGTTYADTGWVLSTNDPITLGTTSLTFTQFSSAGIVTASGALTKTANNITHNTSGVGAGTYNNVTVDTYGHVTAGSNVSYLTAEADTLASVTGRGTTTATNVTLNGGVTSFNNATSNILDFGGNGNATPTFTTRSAGTKIVLRSTIGASTVDYAIGADSNTGAVWFSTPTNGAGNVFNWYGGTTLVATLTGLGNLTLNGTTLTLTNAGSVSNQITTTTASQQVTLALNNTGLATDQKKIEIIQSGTSGNFVIRFINDAYTLASNILSATRDSGTYTVATVGIGVSTTDITLNGPTTFANVDNQITVYRNASQYLVIENNDTSANPYFTSYSATTNAKNIIFDSRTDVAGTAPSAGTLGFDFQTNGTAMLQLRPTFVYANAGTASTTPTSGALQVSGGVGVSGNINAGGYITAVTPGSSGQLQAVGGTASTWYNAFLRNDGSNVYLLSSAVQTTQDAATNAILNSYRPFSWSLSTGAVTIDGAGNNATIGTSTSTVTINGTVKLPNVGTSGFVKLSTGGQLVQDTSTYLTSYTETDTLATVTGRGATTATALTLTNATASTSTSTGAIVVTGGVGIGGAVYIGGNTTLTGDIAVNEIGRASCRERV